MRRHVVPLLLALVGHAPTVGAQPSASFGEAPSSQGTAPVATPGAPSDYTGPQHYDGSGREGFESGEPEAAARPCRPDQPGFTPYVRRPECASLPFDAAPDPVRVTRTVRGGPRYHDGLYARLGFTIGGTSDTMTSDRARLGDFGTYRGVEVKHDGVTPGTHLAIGFTPIAGLALAGSLETATIVAGESDSFRFRGGSVSDGYVFKTAQLELIGLLVDWYPWPEKGFHVQASPGFAVFIAGQGDTPANAPRLRAHTATGWGSGFGVGYEWWIGDEWGLGLLGRVLYASVSGQDAPGNEWSHRMLAAAIGVTATYH